MVKRKLAATTQLFKRPPLLLRVPTGSFTPARECSPMPSPRRTAKSFRRLIIRLLPVCPWIPSPEPPFKANRFFSKNLRYPWRNCSCRRSKRNNNSNSKLHHETCTLHVTACDALRLSPQLPKSATKPSVTPRETFNKNSVNNKFSLNNKLRRNSSNNRLCNNSN